MLLAIVSCDTKPQDQTSTESDAGKETDPVTDAEKEQPKEKKPKPERPKNNDKAIARLEREIARQEARIAELDHDAEQYGSDYQKLMEIQAERDGLEAGLMELYERWEELNE